MILDARIGFPPSKGMMVIIFGSFYIRIIPCESVGGPPSEGPMLSGCGGRANPACVVR